MDHHLDRHLLTGAATFTVVCACTFDCVLVIKWDYNLTGWRDVGSCDISIKLKESTSVIAGQKEDVCVVIGVLLAFCFWQCEYIHQA